MRKAESEHLNRVAEIGCIVCLNERFGKTPANIHHIRDGYGRGQRAPHNETIPLCHIHHQSGDGTVEFKGQVGYHFNPAEFERRYGMERQLLEQVRGILNGA